MTGRIITFEVPWYETGIENCSYCGKMFARHYWADDDYADDKFCEQACADVKRRMAGEQV
jgi:NMD protein affecting ribosome stability and mRNA decay